VTKFIVWLLALIDGPAPMPEMLRDRPKGRNRIYPETGCTCAPEIEWQDSCHHHH